MTRLEQDFEIIAATYTPFDNDGALNVDALAAYAAYLKKNRVSGVFCNGTTGESLSLTVGERLSVAAYWGRQASDDFRVIAHVGDNCVHVAKQLASQAQEAGCSGIAAMAPTFFRPNSVDALLDFLQPIAAAAGDLEFYYYHIPSLTGVALDMDPFISAAVEKIPNFAGIKYTHENLVEFGQIQAKWGRDYRLYFGRDELLLPALTLDCRGAVGTSYNFMPLTVRALVEAWNSRQINEAQRRFRSCGQLIDLLIEFGVLEAGKPLMTMLGIECGNVRLPLRPVAQDKTWQLLRQVQALRLDDEICNTSYLSAACNGS